MYIYVYMNIHINSSIFDWLICHTYSPAHAKLIKYDQNVFHDLQYIHVAVCGRVSQCVTEQCSTLQCVAQDLPMRHWSVSLTGSISSIIHVRCSVLQYVIVCCSVLQCVAVCCSVLQNVAQDLSVSHWSVSPKGSISSIIHMCCSVCVIVCCSMLQSVAVCCSVLQCVAQEGLQRIAVCDSVLQCIALSCNRPATIH